MYLFEPMNLFIAVWAFGLYYLQEMHTAISQPKPVIISGHFEHAPLGDTVRIEYGQYKARIPLSLNGDFKIELQNVITSTPASLWYHRQHASIYISPGDSINFVVDFTKFDETIHFMGHGAESNNYLAQALWRFEYDPSGVVTLPQQQIKSTTTPSQMRKFADDFREQRYAFLDNYAKNHPLTNSFKYDACLHIDLQWAITLLDYSRYYREAAGTGLPLNTSYFNFLKQLPLKSLDNYFGRDQYESSLALLFLTAYSARLIPSGKLSSQPDSAPKLYSQATKELGRTASRDKAIYQLLSYQLDSNILGVQAAMPTFRIENRDSLLARNLRGMLAKQLQLQPGKGAPDFTLLDDTGKKVSLSNYKGKIVFLDFWGTWCSPCIAELPINNELRKRFIGRDAVFIYISVGDSEEKWHQAIDKYNLKSSAGIQLHSPDNIVASSYQVYAYPTHILINRNGSIIKTNIPITSDVSEIESMINNALNE